MANAVLTFSELQRAIDHCMAEHPPSGEERRLHKDANTMAGLWAPMLLQRRADIPLEEVDASVLGAFDRWKDGPPEVSETQALSPDTI